MSGDDSEPIPNLLLHYLQLRVKATGSAIFHRRSGSQGTFSSSEDIISEPEDRSSGSKYS